MSDKSYIDRLEEKLEYLKEILEAMARPPYQDSDLESLIEWVNSTAKQALNKCYREDNE